jgi:hypothetical protein
MEKQTLVYANYWRSKELLASGVPKFPLLKWWPSSELSEVEQIIFNKIKDYDSLLDIGAGSLNIMRKFQHAGYSGEYHTQDIGQEFKYDYVTLEEIQRKYSAILCLDVIEHLQLTEGLTMLRQLFDLLAPEGTIVIQTPNGRCIRSPLSSDMTHLHCYNLSDLWSYLTCMGLQVIGYRVVFEAEKLTIIERIISLPSKYLITRVLGLDYADNILLIGYKPNII